LLFFNFFLQHLVVLKLGFIILFCFPFYKVILVSLPGLLVRRVNSCHFFISSFNVGFAYLASRVNSSFVFVIFLVEVLFFLNFILQHLIDLKLGSMFFFSMRLSWSHYRGHEFGRLIYPDLVFLIDIFFQFMNRIV
jgi:hypothetical protein